MKPRATTVKPREAVKTPKRRALNKWLFAQLLKDQTWRCAQWFSSGCIYHDLRKGNCEVDHIIPLAAGGTNDLSNLQLLCKACHKRKSDALDKKAAAKIKRQALAKGQQATRAAKGSKLKSRNDLGGAEYQRRKAWTEKAKRK